MSIKKNLQAVTGNVIMFIFSVCLFILFILNFLSFNHFMVSRKRLLASNWVTGGEWVVLNSMMGAKDV